MALPNRNLLSDQTSPYLLQHKDNPVHWRAWSDGALEEAQELEKPILLSIGYAACHWCHVMAHESFEDPGVADVMNRLFVNIKVDREERPDIDQIYMAALQATGEQGGWPLTMFLTPQAKPFWGGTYFPKSARYGRPSFVDVLNAISDAWREKEADLSRSAHALADHVQAQLAPAPDGAASQEPPLADFAGGIASLIDDKYGGLRGAPKFPNAPLLDILWLNWLENRDASHRDGFLQSLRFMLSGGIYDHVGGGISRYSTDALWLVPHFEKMLYDNAQLIRHCCFAFAETREEIFRRRVEETLSWLLREMHTEDGGFAASLDADSEGEEGKFYLWTREQVEEVLGEEAHFFLTRYDLATPQGWEGDPIIHRLGHPQTLPDREEDRLAACLDKLREAREARTRPGRDDKVLVDWNGMAIGALAMGGRQFKKPDWIEAAANAFHFISGSQKEGRLPHSLRGGKSLFPALASDYAAMISAAISLHQATQDQNLLDQARRWAEILDQWYADESATGYFLTASDAADVPMRIRGDVDDAVPSATAQIIIALVQLSTATGNYDRYEHVVRVAEAALARIRRQRHGQAGIVHAAALARTPMKLFINDDSNQRFVPVANRNPDPRRVDIVLGENQTAAERALELTIDHANHGAWLCVGQACLPPLHDPVALEASLRAPGHQF